VVLPMTSSRSLYVDGGVQVTSSPNVSAAPNLMSRSPSATGVKDGVVTFELDPAVDVACWGSVAAPSDTATTMPIPSLLLAWEKP
jgi:hypothetical protein